MRFRFCGDVDCPEWILVQIQTMARMSSIKMKLMSQVVAESLATNKPLNYDKAKKLTIDAKFEEGELKTTLSALTYILASASKYGVSEMTLINELQQIGFPREHGQALCRVYNEQFSAILSELQQLSLRSSKLINVHAQPLGEHTVLTITYWSASTDSQHKYSFTISSSQLATLLHDLKSCGKQLDSLEKEYL